MSLDEIAVPALIDWFGVKPETARVLVLMLKGSPVFVNAETWADMQDAFEPNAFSRFPAGRTSFKKPGKQEALEAINQYQARLAGSVA